MKFSKTLLVILAVIVATGGAFIYYSVATIKVEQLNDDVFVLRGLGGNTTVVKTSQGTVVIDSMTVPMQGRIIQQKAEQLTGQAVSVLINTHYHLDHTQGNPGFSNNLRIISTDKTLAHLTNIDGDDWQGDKAEYLPNETFDKQLTLRLGDKTLDLIHPGRGHTDGDLVVYIRQLKTAVMGDLFFNRHYPNIDLEAGGSVQRWPLAIDKVLGLGVTTVIPGHGATSNELGLKQFRRFMAQLGTIARQASAQDWSLERMLATDQLDTDTGFKELAFAGIPLGLDREFVLKRAWEESSQSQTASKN